MKTIIFDIGGRLTSISMPHGKRQQIVDMWRVNNITCLQCDLGDF